MSDMILSRLEVSSSIIIIILVITVIFYLICGGIEYRCKKYIKNMKKYIDKKFSKAVFEKTYVNLADDVEKIRKEQLKTIRIIVFLVTFFIIGTIILLLNLVPQIFYGGFNEGLLYLVVFFVVIVLVIIDFVISARSQPYDNVVNKILQSINPNIKYDISIGTDFAKAYNIIYDIYKCAEFSAKVGMKSIASKYIEYDLTARAKVKMVEIYEGFPIRNGSCCDVFEGFCIKLKREKMVANEILIGRNMRVIKLDNNIKTFDEFEKYFDLNATNQFDAESRINDWVRNEILNLYKEYGITFEISLKGNFLYVRFFTGKLFEIGAIVNPKKLHRDYIIFKSILEIIEKLDDIL